MHNEDMDRVLDVAALLLYDVNTNVYSAADNAMITDDATIDILADDDDDMDPDDNVDAEDIYKWTRPERERETLLDPRAWRYRVRHQRRRWVQFLAHGTGRVHT